MKIIVNGTEHQWDGGRISYGDINHLAGQDGRRLLSVTYSWQSPVERDLSRSGILAPGQYVNPAEGMVFNAVWTGNA